MDSNESFSLSQGASLPLVVQALDASGLPAAGFAGTEALATVVWPGGNRAASFSPATTWADAAAGKIRIAVASAQTTALAPGRYRLLTRSTAPSADPVDVYACTIDVEASAGSAPAPKSYCDFDVLLQFGRSWLRQLQTPDDEAGFAEQLGRARSWVDDLAHAHYRVASMAVIIGGQALGPRISGARSAWLQEQLDADKLMLTDQVREMAARKALGLICEAQVGLGNNAAQYARLARMYHAQANYLATCVALSLDTDGDGYADVTIDCSCTSPLYG